MLDLTQTQASLDLHAWFRSAFQVPRNKMMGSMQGRVQQLTSFVDKNNCTGFDAWHGCRSINYLKSQIYEIHPRC